MLPHKNLLPNVLVRSMCREAAEQKREREAIAADEAAGAKAQQTLELQAQVREAKEAATREARGATVSATSITYIRQPRGGGRVIVRCASNQSQNSITG